MTQRIMTDGEILLAAIVANPADDAPRLIYADWLEEHEQRERAEFIRVQIAISKRHAKSFGGVMKCITSQAKLDKINKWVCNCENCALRKHEKELLDDQKVYALTVTQFMVCGDYKIEWSRGFPYRLRIEWAEWVKHWEYLRGIAPLEEVQLITLPQVRDSFIEDNLYVSVNMAPQERNGIWKSSLVELSEFENNHALALRGCILKILTAYWQGITFTLPE